MKRVLLHRTSKTDGHPGCSGGLRPPIGAHRAPLQLRWHRLAGCLLLLLPVCGYGQGVAGGGAVRGGGSMSVPAVHWVSLSWTASTSPGVAGYNVYRSQTSGSGYTKINSALVPSLAYNDSSVTPGQTYYYVATAVSTGGVESAYSNEASATVPSP